MRFAEDTTLANMVEGLWRDNGKSLYHILPCELPDCIQVQVSHAPMPQSQTPTRTNTKSYIAATRWSTINEIQSIGKCCSEQFFSAHHDLDTTSTETAICSLSLELA